MLKTLRNPKNVKRIMWGTLIMIIPAFIAFYGWSQLTGSRNDSLTFAAKVNGKEISLDIFNHYYQRYFDQVRQNYGENFDEEMAAEMNLAGQVLEELENQELVIAQAPKAGVEVSDMELDIVIKNTPAFQTNGVFDPQQFRQFLAQQRIPNMAFFEQETRKDRILSKMRLLITDFVKVSEPEIRQEYQQQFEKINIDLVRFATPEYIQKVNVTDGEAQAFYNSHKQEFQIPPQYNLAYLNIDPKSFEKDITVTEKDIKDYYDMELSSFTVPERVNVRHILAAVPQNPNMQQDQAAQKRITDALQRLNAKEPFEKVAKELSMDNSAKDGGSLGWIKRTDTVPEFEKQAFTTPVGQTSKIFRTQFGYHIIKVDKKEEARIKSLDEVKSEVIAKLKTLAIDSASLSKGDQIMAEFKSGDSILTLAGKYGFSKGTTGWFFGTNIPEIGTNKEIATNILTMTPGKIAGPFKTETGYYIIQLAGRQESRIPGYAEIENKIKAQMMFQKAQELSNKTAQEADQEIQKGTTLEAIASKYGTKITGLGPFTVDENIPGIGKRSQMAQTAYYLPVGKTSGVIKVEDPANRGFIQYFIIRVKSKEGISEAGYLEQKEKITQTVLNRKKQMVFAEYIANLRKKATIKPNETLLANYQPKKNY